MLNSPNGPRRATALVFFAILLLPLLAVPVFAHGGIVQGVPGPGQSVGGTVDHIQLLFAEPVNEAVVTVEDATGQVLTGTIQQPVPNLLELSTDGVVAEGDYIVRYRVIFDDGVEFRSAYQFTYASGSPAPLPMDPEAVALSPGLPWSGMAIGLAAISVVLLLLRFGVRLTRLRSAERAAVSV